MSEAPAATPEKPEPESKKKPTQYTILRKHKPDLDPQSPSAAVAQPDLYEVVGMQLVRSGGGVAAISTFVNEHQSPDGSYVATPSRSWTEKPVKAETQTKLIVG